MESESDVVADCVAPFGDGDHGPGPLARLALGKAQARSRQPRCSLRWNVEIPSRSQDEVT